MKSISQTVYENLTPRQRVIATIEAEARDDQDEVQRLVKTCPKKTYLQTDAAYQDTMQALMSAALAVECDLLNMALVCVLVVKRNFDLFDRNIQHMADIEAAWQAVLEDHGIAPDVMAKAAPIRHPILDYLLENTPPPDPEGVQVAKKLLERGLNLPSAN